LRGDFFRLDFFASDFFTAFFVDRFLAMAPRSGRHSLMKRGGRMAVLCSVRKDRLSLAEWKSRLASGPRQPATRARALRLH
jgi:hypothetical protein